MTSDAAEQHPDFVCPDAALQDDPRAPTKGHGHTHCRVRSLTSLTSSALGVLDKGNGKKHWVKGWKVLQVCAAF